MAREVDNDLLFIVCVDRLFFENGLPVQVVEVIVLPIDEEDFPVQHLVMNVLVVVGEAVPHFFHIFLSAADDVIEEVLLCPFSEIDEHHACVEVALCMNPGGLEGFEAVCHDGAGFPRKIKIPQVGQVPADHHVPVEIEHPVCRTGQGRRHEEAVEEGCHAVRKEERRKALVVNKVHIDGPAREVRCFFKTLLFFAAQVVHKEMKRHGKVWIVLRRGEHDHPHVGDVVFRAGKGDMKGAGRRFFSYKDGVCHRVIQYICHKVS